MRFIIVFTIALTLSFGLTAQSSINNYKYVILPKKFDFLKQEDQYRLNTQTRYMLKKKGFEVFYSDETLPDEVAQNNCTALKANVVRNNSLLRTKLQLEFRDCRNQVLYLSDEGVSREKQFEVAYKEALTKAFASFEQLQYSYMPANEEVVADTPPMPEEVKEEVVEEAPVKTEVKEIVSQAKKDTEVIEVVEMKENKEERKAEVAAKVKDDKEKAKAKSLVRTNSKIKSNVLVASLEGNKYQVSNGEKVVMTLFYTSMPNVYIVKGKDAILFKRGANWILSETDGESLSEKILQIDFQ